MQTFTPAQYLQIDIASNFGLDKEDWQPRLDWFAENQEQIEELGMLNEPEAIQSHPLMAAADEPALFFAGIRAWMETRTGGSTAYPISLDATASGAQILALLVGCPDSARLCNVINNGHRTDFYTAIYQEMLALIEDDSKLTRKQCKEGIMPWFFGSGQKPKEAFGEGRLLAIFQETMETKAPGLTSLRDSLLELWNPEALSNDWVLPDNYHVHIKVMGDHTDFVQFLNRPYEVISKVNRPMDEGRSLVANTTHSIDGLIVREMARRCSYDRDKILNLMKVLTQEASYLPARKRPQDELVKTLWDHYQTSGFLSARILELLDDENIHLVDRDVIRSMLLTLPEKPFQVLAVHDCFRVHPNYGNDLRRQYNQILHELTKSDILKFIVSQIVGHEIQVTKYADIADKVLETEYALS